MADNDPFIGKTLVVNQASNESLVGLNGTIVDETKESFVIRMDDKEKRILKREAVFTINGEIVKGDKIAKRLEDRIKSRRK